jgi:CMP/dCMP kinase
MLVGGPDTPLPGVEDTVIVAIDGPAGSGKSTVAKAAARRLGFAYLDTGAMYRAVTWLALHLGIELDDEAAVAELAREHPVRFEHAEGEPLPTRVEIAGHDVTRAVRTPEVDAAVSIVAKEPAVREAMVEQQRRAAEAARDCVVEGRDIGTVVFPDAALKVFLTASPEERAKRRHEQHVAAGHGDETHAAVLAQLEVRDRIDSTREASPLKPAPDAVVLDTTGMDIEQVVDRIVELVRERQG